MYNITLNTIRELLRNKFSIFIVFLGIAFLSITGVLNTLALGELQLVLYGFGTSFMELTGVMIILFLGGAMIYREIEGRTIYLMLSKPIDRATIIFGKFFGFAIVLLGTVIFQLALVTLALWHNNLPIESMLFVVTLGIYLKLLALLAVILFFSTFTSSLISMFLTIAIYFIGSSGYILLQSAIDKGNEWLHTLGIIVVTFAPNFSAINTIKSGVGTKINPENIVIFQSYGIMLIYIVLIVFLAGMIFRKKTFDAS